MASTTTLQIDSNAANKWVAAVQEVNKKVQAIMEQINKIMKHLGESDSKGTLGQQIVATAGNYLSKFGKIIEAFGKVISSISDQLGQFVDFALSLAKTIATVASLFGV